VKKIIQSLLFISILLSQTLSAGVINTIAGTGTAGFSGDNGLAAAANLNSPLYMTLDGSGNLYFSDYININTSDSFQNINATYS